MNTHQTVAKLFREIVVDVPEEAEKLMRFGSVLDGDGAFCVVFCSALVFLTCASFFVTGAFVNFAFSTDEHFFMGVRAFVMLFISVALLWLTTILLRATRGWNLRKRDADANRLDEAIRSL